ncbi:type II toxin-antitoxin system RelE/ParE family toxin [Flavobacterium sp. LC2016-01]|uniref:type II toxin-antitoxin system RelE/ParE family toxin n=1 Tax=Flavobacterium sp. LC2016-01 TaxID=2675876 RepID=UPI001E4AF6C5|nr:type II toxin-antitoxin system RelE/ParE family toxin [Flavobacterium sp. LC2016-01]
MRNMVFKIKILPLAEKEIDESIEFYESRSKGLGKQFLTYLRYYLKVLKTNPELFEIKKQPGYREMTLVKFPFVIIYEIIETDIIIHSVFHTSRNPERKP